MSRILTPYYRTILEPEICSLEPETKYTSYELFCLHTQMQMAFEDYELVLSTVEDHGRMVWSIRFLVDGKEQTLTPTQLGKANSVLAQAVGGYKDACILLSSGTLIPYKDRMLPEVWLQSVLSFLPVPEEYQPFVSRGDHLYLYLRISSDDYRKEYEDLLFSLIDRLVEWYDRGVIACTAPFGQRWRLVADIYDNDPVITFTPERLLREVVLLPDQLEQGWERRLPQILEEEYTGQTLREGYGLYRPTWFAGGIRDRVGFLIERQVDQEDVILYNPNLTKNQQERILQTLAPWKVSFTAEGVIIPRDALGDQPMDVILEWDAVIRKIRFVVL